MHFTRKWNDKEELRVYELEAQDLHTKGVGDGDGIEKEKPLRLCAVHIENDPLWEVYLPKRRLQVSYASSYFLLFSCDA